MRKKRKWKKEKERKKDKKEEERKMMMKMKKKRGRGYYEQGDDGRPFSGEDIERMRELRDWRSNRRE